MKLYREAKKLKQKDIANETGLSKAAISLFENCKLRPSVESAFKIAKVLGVTIDDLYNSEKSASEREVKTHV